MLTLYNEGSTLGSIKFNCPTLYNDQHWGYLPMLLVHKALLLVSSWSTVRSCLALTRWEDPHPTFGLICWFALTRTHAFVAPKLPLLLWCPQFASQLGQNLQRPSFQILSGKFELQSEQNIEMPTRLPRRIRNTGNLIGHTHAMGTTHRTCILTGGCGSPEEQDEHNNQESEKEGLHTGLTSRLSSTNTLDNCTARLRRVRC